jgi:predicted ABC-type ATPase
MEYPLRSTNEQLERAKRFQDNYIENNMTNSDYSDFFSMQWGVERLGRSSQITHSENGKYKEYRKKLHSKILMDKFKSRKSIDRKDPDLYIMGGVAASGKTSVLRGYIREPVTLIDSDSFKAALASHTPHPLQRSYPLAHAPYIHEESSSIFDAAMKKALDQKRNLVLDMTMGNYEKAKKIIDKFKAKGYDVHLLGTQLAPHTAIRRATKRFIHGREGRYVPATVIASKGNQINANVLKARRLTRYRKGKKTGYSYIIMDSTKFKQPRMVFKSGNMKENQRNPARG